METRNTPVLREVVEVLGPQLSYAQYALNTLERHFANRFIVDAGNVVTVAAYAEQLRLQISEQECSTVLDHIAEEKMVMVTIDHVETAINALFDDRFIEP